MPMVVAGAIVAGLVEGAVAGTVIAGLAAFAGSLILGGLSYALTPKPKAPGAAVTNNDSTVAIRQSDMNRMYVYGHTRAVKGFAHMEATETNGKLHLITILCQGPVRAIREIWVDNYCIPDDWLDADGNVTQGTYKGFMQIRKHNGEIDQLADSQAILNMTDWTINCRLQGIAYIYVILTKSQDVYPNGVPNITAIVEGPSLFDPRTNGLVWSPNIALFALDYITADYGFAAGQADVDLVNVSAQANICDEIVAVTPEAHPVLSVAPTTDIITLTDTLLSLQFGDQVQVSSTGTLPGGLAVLTNYYVIPYQILTVARILLATSLTNALNKVAIDLTTAGAGTITVSKVGEPRYHGGGQLDTGTALTDNLTNMCNSMAGRAICVAGAWSLLAGAWRTPTLELTIDDMRQPGPVVKNCQSMSDSYNSVQGIFNGPTTLYQNTNYPNAQYQTFIDRDLGVEATADLDLPFTTRPTTAQRIAKIELFRGQQGIAVTCPFSLKALQAQAGDNIGLTMDKYGWANKFFEITSFTFDTTQLGLVCSLELRETAQAIFDWTAGEAIDFDPAPNTNLPDAFNVGVPTGVGYNSRSSTTQSGDTIYTLTLEWDVHPDAFVREYGNFEIQYKLSSSDDWLPSFNVAGIITDTDVVSASIGIHYDLRIRAINNLGVRSPWATLTDAVIGSSGGIVATNDWGSVASSVTTSNDWGSVTSAVTTTNDWGFVV